MKKISCIILSILLIVGLCSCEKKKEQKDDIYIFFTSDVHCGVAENVTLAGLKALVDDTKAEHDYVTLVDCGDYIQGGPIGTLSKGELIISLMNDAGYDIVTIGNHEFDYGMEQLGKLLTQMNCEVVASNVRYSGSKENIFKDTDAYTIVDYDGTKVAFIGILTPTSVTSSTPKFFMEGDEYVYDFYGGDNGEELIQKIQETVDEVRGEGADYVVVLSHLGSVEPEYNSIALISATEGIDVVLDGHSHSLIVEDLYPNRNGEDVILSSVGTKMEAVGELIIGKDGTINTLHISEYDRSDELMEEKVNEAFGQLEAVLSQEIRELDHDLKISDEDGIRMVRSRETTMADLVADAYRYALNTDVAVVNGGGVRANIQAGVVTYQDLLNVTPFQNELASCVASGQQIMDALEYGARICEKIYKFEDNPVAENGAFLQVSGLKYTIDTSVESAVLLDENNMFCGYSSDARRVKDVMVLSGDTYVPIDPEAYYSVASVAYVLFENGDGNTAFQGAEKLIENGPVDINALIDYFVSLNDLNERYRETEGRITIE